GVLRRRRDAPGRGGVSQAVDPTGGGAALLSLRSREGHLGGWLKPFPQPEAQPRTQGGFVRSEREKMLAGELYDPLDPELVRARDRARDLCQDLNATREADQAERRRILRELFGAGGADVWMQPPFFCDYGSNILLGTKCFFNFNCIVLDVCEVRVGDY